MLTSLQLQRLTRVHQARQSSCRVSRSPAATCSAAVRGSDVPSTSSPALSAAAAAAAAAILHLSASGASFAAPLYDTLPGFGGDTRSAFFQAVEQEVQQRKPDLDDLFDENLMTEDLRRFVDSVSGNKLKPEQYQAERLKMNFRREMDGRVSLRNRQGQWFSVRPDLEVPGFLLLRNQATSAVFFLPPADDDALAQLDLSDDLVVAQLFYNTAWQDVMAPLGVEEEGGVQQLQLSAQEFRDVATLVDGAMEQEDGEEEGAAEAEEQQGQQ